MKNVYFLIPIVCTLTFISCGKSKKQSLAVENEEKAVIIAPKDSLQESKVVYNSAKAQPALQKQSSGIGKREINSSSPPVKLNLLKEDTEAKGIDLADYYKKVRYVKLKHPLSSRQGIFLANTTIEVNFGNSMAFDYIGNPQVFFSDQDIIAGDRYLGYHVYDLSGKFSYTLALPDKLPSFDKQQHHGYLQANGMKGEITDFSVFKETALIATKEDGLYKMHLYNLKRRKGEYTTSYDKRPDIARLINRNEYISYNPLPDFKQRKAIWSVVNGIQGNIVSEFLSFNPILDPDEKVFTFPEYNIAYYYNDQLFLRQAFNDTIYKVQSPQTLEAVYILDTGNKKLTVKDAATAKTKDKLIFGFCLETNDFLYLHYSLDRDVPHMVETNQVKFRDYFFDKKDKHLYRIQMSTFPEGSIIKNSLKDTLPLKISDTRWNGRSLYATYTKQQLGEILRSNYFSELSTSQQQKTREMYDSTNEDELVLMILERS